MGDEVNKCPFWQRSFNGKGNYRRSVVKIMRQTPKGRVLVEEGPHPLQKVEDHLWLVLTLSLAEATSQKDSDARVQNFCEVFNDSGSRN
jgi:hypothetical protein